MSKALGRGWIVGHWLGLEKRWCRAVYRDFEEAVEPGAPPDP
jgi:hypothetical protein